jgi:hypothetical protein
MVRFLTLDEVVANAMTVIPDAKKEMRPYFDQWAWLALREIGPAKENVNVATLTLEDLSFKKPDDYVSAIDLSLFDTNNQEIKYHLRSGKQRIHQVDAPLSFIELSDGEHYYYVSSNAADFNLNHALLRYYAMPLDENGRPVVPDYMTVAIMAFCRYMWALRSSANNGATDLAERTWRIEKARASSNAKMPDMLMGKQIAREWMSMIDKFDPYKY